MKQTYYFQHDYNARNDPKLQDVLVDLGVEGLGVFWCIVEQLYEHGGTMPLRSCKSIAFALHVDCKLVDSLVRNYGLFKSDCEKFWSESVLNRLNRRKGVSDKRKLAAFERWKKCPENKSSAQPSANAMQMEDENDASDANAMQMGDESDASDANSANTAQVGCKCNANAAHKENKVYKYIKEREKEKHETAKRFVPPSIEEVKSYIQEKGYSIDAEAFIAFYESNGWMVGKNKMKNWRMAIVTWTKRDYSRPAEKVKDGIKFCNDEWK